MAEDAFAAAGSAPAPPAGEPEAARPRPTRVLCLGEALIDLICERPLDDPAQADAFVAHFGGAVANVAVVAARAGARVRLAGGAGSDDWGRWLLARLLEARVDTELFILPEGVQTPLALVTVDAEGDASYTIYGEGIETVVHALAERLEEAVESSAALFFSSNTLVGEREREVTMAARERALALGRHVIFDPNLRLHRWRSQADAQASANACVPGALLVRASLEEARLMTGERDAERAATALLKAGARLVVLGLGAAGAMLRGELRADVPGVQAHVRSTIGAGDALTGVLLASLARSGFYPPAVAASLPEAVLAGARACERWGAID
jgi:sugar/nucleoside kinase (ribokinase family)